MCVFPSFRTAIQRSPWPCASEPFPPSVHTRVARRYRLAHRQVAFVCTLGCVCCQQVPEGAGMQLQNQSEWHLPGLGWASSEPNSCSVGLRHMALSFFIPFSGGERASPSHKHTRLAPRDGLAARTAEGPGSGGKGEFFCAHSVRRPERRVVARGRPGQGRRERTTRRRASDAAGGERAGAGNSFT